jgi:hypothetical protein
MTAHFWASSTNDQTIKSSTRNCTKQDTIEVELGK